MVPSVLIVDDEKHTREGLQQALQEHYDVSVASNADEAFNLMEAQEFEVIVTDLRMPGKSGLKVIDKALTLANKPAVIMMTAYGTIENAVEAMRRGASDYVPKSTALPDVDPPRIEAEVDAELARLAGAPRRHPAHRVARHAARRERGRRAPAPPHARRLRRLRRRGPLAGRGHARAVRGAGAVHESSFFAERTERGGVSPRPASAAPARPGSHAASGSVPRSARPRYARPCAPPQAGKRPGCGFWQLG